MANIKYEIFQSRKRFNIVKWIKANRNKTYEDFKSFLNTKSVIAPSEEYFQKVLSSIEKKEQVESKSVEESRKETIPIDIELSIPEVKQELNDSLEEEKHKSRRRRRKKESDES